MKISPTFPWAYYDICTVKVQLLALQPCKSGLMHVCIQGCYRGNMHVSRGNMHVSSTALLQEHHACFQYN